MLQNICKKNVDGQITQDKVKCDYLITLKPTMFEYCTPKKPSYSSLRPNSPGPLTDL